MTDNKGEEEALEEEEEAEEGRDVFYSTKEGEEGGTTDAPPPDTEQVNPPPPEDSNVEPEASDSAAPLASADLESDSFPLKNEAILKELAAADEQSKNTVSLIEQLRLAIAELKQKENLTEEDTLEILSKQNELAEKLSALETITKHIQDLAGLNNVSSSVLGPPLQCRDVGFIDPCRAIKEFKTPELPKVIICGNDSQNQIPKIIVCDPIDQQNAKSRPVFQQFPGRPQSCGDQALERSPCNDKQQVPAQGRGYIQGSQGPSAGQFTPNMPQYQMGMPQQGFAGGPQPMTPNFQSIRPSFGGARGVSQPGYGKPIGMPMLGGPMADVGGTMPQFGWGQTQMQGMPSGVQNMPMTSRQMPLGFPTPQGIVGGQERMVQMPTTAALMPPQMVTGLQTRPQSEGFKGQTTDEMQKQLEGLQAEMKTLAAENAELKKQLASPNAKLPEKPLCKMTIGKVPICKLDLYKQMDLPLPSPIQPNTENTMSQKTQPFCKRMLGSGQPACRLDLYKEMGLPYPGLGVGGDGQTHDVETMVSSLEEEVRSIQKELDGVQAERRALELQKKLLQCTSPIIGQKVDISTPAPTNQQTLVPIQPAAAMAQNGGNGGQMQQLQLRELREQYNKLQQDYRLKVEEVSLLRVELEGAKRESLVSIEKTEEAEARVDDLLERLRAAETEKQKISTTRDQMIELEQQLIMAKQRYREASEEAEELKVQLNDQLMQVEEYREKYLKAQETVEEQRRQLDLNEIESNRLGEQVALEIQRVKSQFQSKLEELTPLPEILKKSQEKLKETLHLKALAEKNCMIMSKNLESANEQKEKLKKQLDEINRNKILSEAEKASLQGNLTDGEKKMEETKAENAKLRASVARLEELVLKNERKFEEKVHEALQLQSQLETLREESARQVSRTKDRCENIRRTLLGQISELERQLATARAIAKAAQKDRDDIRQKMQAQITHLNDNFEQAQIRIRNLQSHVNYLKNSFTNIIAPVDVPISIEKLFPDEEG